MDVVNLVGAPVTLEWTTDASTGPALAITLPDGTAGSTPAPTHDGTKYSTTFTPTLPGRHTLLWSTAAASHADIVDVWPTSPRYLVSRADAIERLRGSRTSIDSKFDALMLYIAAATAVVESVTGPLIKGQRTWKEVPAFPARSIVLPHEEIDVTQVTIDGSELAPADYIVDEDAGIVSSLVGYFEPLTRVVVTYTAGSEQIAPQARQACLEILAHMWQLTRQSGRPVAAGEETATTPIGFAIPKRALELLLSMPRAAGVA